MRIYFDSMRRIVSTTTQHGEERGPKSNRVHHVEREHEQVWFHTETHFFWATCQLSWATTTTRLVERRANGDSHAAPWTRVGAPVEAMVAGPSHGGAP